MFKDKSGRELTSFEAVSKVKSRIYNYIADFGLLVLYLLCLVPSHYFRRLILRISGMRIGSGSSLHISCRFFSPQNIEIGQDSIIGSGAFLDGRDVILIGNHVDIASDVMIYNSEHDVNSELFAAILSPVEIGDYAFIGPRVIILPGVKIGRGAVVAAGAVVTKNVDDFSIVGGVPAKVIGERRLKNPKYQIGRARWFQ